MPLYWIINKLLQKIKKHCAEHLVLMFMKEDMTGVSKDLHVACDLWEENIMRE